MPLHTVFILTEPVLWSGGTQRINDVDKSVKGICCRTDLGFPEFRMFSCWTGSPLVLQRSSVPFLLRLLGVPSSPAKKAAADTAIR